MKLPWKRSAAPAAVVCPRCGRARGVRVVFGLPTEKTAVAADKGEVVLGGCVMAPGDVRQCTACGTRWTRPAA